MSSNLIPVNDKLKENVVETTKKKKNCNKDKKEVIGKSISNKMAPKSKMYEISSDILN